MTYTRDQVHKELERRYRVAEAELGGEGPIPFDFFLYVRDYVALVEQTPTLHRVIQEDRENWSRKEKELEALKGGVIGWFRYSVNRGKQTDFHVSRPYRKLLQIFHTLNYLNGGVVPEKFDWDTDLERASGDMQDMQIDNLMPPIFFWWRNIFAERKETYRSWIKRTHSALLRSSHISSDTQTALSVAVLPSVSKFDLELNERTGDFSLGGVRGNLTPKSQEYRIFNLLRTSLDHFASYTDLIHAVYPTGEGSSKSLRQEVYKIIVRLNQKMSAPDGYKAIQNVRNSGFRLVLEPKENIEE